MMTVESLPVQVLDDSPIFCGEYVYCLSHQMYRSNFVHHFSDLLIMCDDHVVDRSDVLVDAVRNDDYKKQLPSKHCKAILHATVGYDGSNRVTIACSFPACLQMTGADLHESLHYDGSKETRHHDRAPAVI